MNPPASSLACDAYTSIYDAVGAKESDANQINGGFRRFFQPSTSVAAQSFGLERCFADDIYLTSEGVDEGLMWAPDVDFG